MNNSVGFAIEKIKLQEQGNEAKLKEKREYEATLSSLQRTIRESLQQIEKSDEDYALLVKKVDALQTETILARTRRDALTAQMEACSKEVEELKALSYQGVMKVWELRSSLCITVQEIADHCDVRALLIKPLKSELTPPPKKIVTVDEHQITDNEMRLRAALERRETAVSERDRLMAEPEVGEAYLRIKNALQYSLCMINSINNEK